jgi:peptidoglycan/LPS O-acetylase OafA/YrhL
MKYRKEIDGLRAIAVLPVILFHAGFTTFSGGFVGVDIFFVISGYLITTIIVDEMDKDSFSLLNFYERRARRILPALFFVMLCTLPFAWFWMLPQDLKSFSKSLVAVPIFASNVFFFLKNGYFDTASELKPLLHTWSLAVEEQYYVLFPVFLMLAWKLGKKWIISLLLIVAIISVLAAQWGSSTQPSFTFFLLPTRAFEMLIGALISLYINHKKSMISVSQSVSQSVSLAGFVLVLYAIFAFDKNTPSPSLYTLIPTVGAGLILIFSNSQNLVGNLLGSKLFAGIGLISYSAYLWHQPLLAFARLRSISEPSIFIFGLLAILSLALGYLSWKFIETPFRSKNSICRKKIFFYGALGSLLFVTLGLIGALTKGFPSRLNSQTIDVSINSEFTDIPRINNGWCFYSIETIKNLSFGENGLKCYLGSKDNKQKKGILFGDSFAGTYEPFWDFIGIKNNIKIQSVTTNWCYPSFNKSFTGPLGSRSYEQCLFNRNFLRENYENYDLVILAGMWSDILSKNQFEDVLSLINEMSSKSKLIVIMPSPKQYDKSPVSQYAKSQWFHNSEIFDPLNVSANNDIKAIEANEILLNIARKYKNVIFLSRRDVFNQRESSANGIPYSAEGVHLSVFGSKDIVKEFINGNAYKNLITNINK